MKSITYLVDRTSLKNGTTAGTPVDLAVVAGEGVSAVTGVSSVALSDTLIAVTVAYEQE